jgi:hypothetical protein
LNLSLKSEPSEFGKSELSEKRSLGFARNIAPTMVNQFSKTMMRRSFIKTLSGEQCASATTFNYAGSEMKCVASSEKINNDHRASKGSANG